MVWQSPAMRSHRPENRAATHNLGISANTAAARDVRKARNAASQERWKIQRIAQELLPDQRVHHCQRSHTGDGVQVHAVPGEGAYFRGVVTCGSVWHCPVCAAKIAEGRREELQQAINAAAREQYEVYLVTYTFRHDATMQIGDTIKELSDGLRRLKSRRAYKRAMKEAGAIGAVRSLEVTWGEANGWHPHVHELVFARRGEMQALEQIRKEWWSVHRKIWGTNPNERCFDVRNGDFAAEYVAKFGHEPIQRTWGAADEATKGHTKKSRHRYTPFDLLRVVAGIRKDGISQGQAVALWSDYAEAFRGRRQLFWSRGLREKLCLDIEQDDQQLAEADPAGEAEPVFIAALDHQQWKAVLQQDARWELLYIASTYGAQAVAEWLHDLVTRKGRRSGLYWIKNRFTSGFSPANG